MDVNVGHSQIKRRFEICALGNITVLCGKVPEENYLPISSGGHSGSITISRCFHNNSEIVWYKSHMWQMSERLNIYGLC